jgi:ATP-dependent Clp protease adapter protein ClpS
VQLSRTAHRKFRYFAAITFGCGALLWCIWRYRLDSAVLVLIFLALLVPGRVLGYFWRDLLTGLRLLQERQFAQSARHSKKFLEDIGRRPWIQHLTWLGSGTYSRNAKSMALNNLGAAEIFLGEFAASRDHLEQSSRLDDENPLPYFNLAQLEMILGNKARSRDSLEQAKRRGYTKNLSDRLVQSAQSRFAFVEGRGASVGADNEEASVVLPPGTSLLSIQELVPANFRCGVEILNDNSTPMEFVVEILQSQLKLAYAEAIPAMLDIQKKGGRLFPTVNPADAQRIAEAISAASSARGHLLVCRAVGTGSQTAQDDYDE